MSRYRSDDELESKYHHETGSEKEKILRELENRGYEEADLDDDDHDMYEARTRREKKELEAIDKFYESSFIKKIITPIIGYYLICLIIYFISHSIGGLLAMLPILIVLKTIQFFLNLMN